MRNTIIITTILAAAAIGFVGGRTSVPQARVVLLKGAVFQNAETENARIEISSPGVEVSNVSVSTP